MNKKKILLCLMPFWSPLSPPLGISLLKGHLVQHGLDAVIYDFNTEDQIWENLGPYFDILEQAIPPHKKGNFHMIGYDIFAQHLVGYLFRSDSPGYTDLLRLLIQKNFFLDIDLDTVKALDKAVADFYTLLGQSVTRLLEQVRPDVLGISVFSPTLGPSLFAFRLAKKILPQVETLMGGGIFADHLCRQSPNFPAFLEKTAPFIDAILVGEGELLLHRYLTGELEKGKRCYGLPDIGHASLDLGVAARPDFSGLNLAAYSQMATYASRSCPFQCNFCSETRQWGKYRCKKGDQIVDEIKFIKEKYGGKLFMFGDSMMNQVMNELSGLLLDCGSGIYWDAYLRASPDIGPEKVKMWRQSGFYRARLGIESGSQVVLDAMNKKITPQTIAHSIKTLADAGIKTTTYWVVGYPGETENDFAETLALVSELKDHIYEADAHPFYFFPQGQVKSDAWTRECGIEPLYPEEFSDILLAQTWVLKASPGREETYDRLSRFTRLCQEAGIPSRHSLMNIYRSDMRWKGLHPHCGPSLLELHNCQFTPGG